MNRRLGHEFDAEFEPFFRYKTLMMDRLRACKGLTHPRNFKGRVVKEVDQLMDDFLLFLKNKGSRKLICGEITKAFNRENSPRKRGLESISDQLQRILSTKVYSDTDSPLKTIMNFGLPSVVTVSRGNGDEYDRICHQARESIEAFEPRLAEPHVYFVKNEKDRHRVDCIVEGRLINGSDTEIIKFPMKIE